MGLSDKEEKPPVVMGSTSKGSLPRSPFQTPPTLSTKGEAAGKFKVPLYPESPVAK
jgi:hypothetical protein